MKFIIGQFKLNNTNSATDGGRIKKEVYMLYTQTEFTKMPKKTIHLDLYVDESKNRTYTCYDGKNETITYIMILAVPKIKKMIYIKS